MTKFSSISFLLGILLLWTFSASAQSDTPPPSTETLPPSVLEAKPKMYRILGDQKKGTKFRHVEAEFPVPFDKTYANLSEQQQNIYKEIYTWLSENKLTADQTPPYPAKGLEALYNPIIRKNKLIAINTKVFFVADIKETGEVDTVKIYSSPNREFNDFILSVMFSTEFVPATCAGEPCAMEFPFEIDLRYVNRSRDINGVYGNDSWQVTQPQ